MFKKYKMTSIWNEILHLTFYRVFLYISCIYYVLIFILFHVFFIHQRLLYCTNRNNQCINFPDDDLLNSEI